MNPTEKERRVTQLHLVKRPVSDETVRVLSQLVADAIAGEVQGIAYVAVKNTRGGYVADAVGLADQDPMFTLGALSALQRALAEKIVERDG